jgi:hypothetical protein
MSEKRFNVILDKYIILKLFYVFIQMNSFWECNFEWNCGQGWWDDLTIWLRYRGTLSSLKPFRRYLSILRDSTIFLVVSDYAVSLVSIEKYFQAFVWN